MDEITEAILKAISEIEGIDLDDVEVIVKMKGERGEEEENGEVSVIHAKLLNNEEWFFPLPPTAK